MKTIYSCAAQGLLALSASVFLAACGGGGGDPTPPSGVVVVPGTDVPLAATQSSQAAFDFANSVVAKGEANTDTPIVLGDAVLASSEDEAPRDVAI
jgi:hypothetical protein